MKLKYPKRSHINWKKGTKGLQIPAHTTRVKMKKSALLVHKEGRSGGFKKGHQLSVDEKNGRWKGNKVGYRAIHCWIYLKKGKASTYKCVDCGKQAEDWSNIDHSYKRKLEDYFPRCRSCHKMYDKEQN